MGDKQGNILPELEGLPVYLSYRTDYKEERRILRKKCGQNGIDLVYDKKNIRSGDSILIFMQNIADACFICIFLTEDYFKSAWTLHEFMLIHARIKDKEGSVLPEFIRLEGEIERIKGILEDENNATDTTNWYAIQTNAEGGIRLLRDLKQGQKYLFKIRQLRCATTCR